MVIAAMATAPAIAEATDEAMSAVALVTVVVAV
jgi:hypothetical protein